MKTVGAVRRRGFTIVELLIVIVVIAILATISIVAYRGIQGRARDSQRLQDMATITKALELYKIQTGEYPESSYNGAGGWEVSSINPDSFLDDLKTSGVLSKIPIDPVNTGNADTSTSRIYAYYRYPAGYGGCDVARGPFYVLMARSGESTSRVTSAPGLTCATLSWNYGFWSGAGFTN